MLHRVALILLLMVPCSVRAAEPYDVAPERPYFVRALHKLGRGALNAVAVPTEVALNSIKEWQIAQYGCGGPSDHISGGV